MVHPISVLVKAGTLCPTPFTNYHIPVLMAWLLAKVAGTRGPWQFEVYPLLFPSGPPIPILFPQEEAGRQAQTDRQTPKQNLALARHLTRRCSLCPLLPFSQPAGAEGKWLFLTKCKFYFHG